MTERALALAAVAVAAAVAAGALAGRASRHAAEPRPDHQRVAWVGSLEVVVPASWTRAGVRTAGVRGLDPAATAVFAPSPLRPARVVATLAPATDPSLIPEPLRKALRAAPAPLRARLGTAAAWRYPPSLTADGRDMQVTVLPTVAGVLAVACVAPPWTWRVAANCDRSVAAVGVPGGGVFAPAADLALRLRLPTALRRLDATRRQERAALAAAHTGGARARAAVRLSTAHAAAAAALVPVAGRAGTELLSALTNASQAYARLGRAASSRTTARYRIARRAVVAAEARLAAALRGLED